MSDLDDLMSRDPLELSAQDIDTIIAYHRQQRARRAAGEKPTKPASASIDISALTTRLVETMKPQVTIKRRI